MTTHRLKIAVVGAGITSGPDGHDRFAVRAHLPALKALSDLYKVEAICTTRRETAAAAARHFDVPHAFDNVEHMLSELPEIDVVCASVLPIAQHQVVMVALRAGKHVYCEQVLGLTTLQAQEMFEIARSKNVRTAVANQLHYEPALLQMAEMVRQGYIGKPLTFNITRFSGVHIAPRPSHKQWLFQAEMCGPAGFRSNNSLEQVMSVIGDITDVCADMGVLVPERPNLDGGPSLSTTVVNNLNFLMRVDNNIMGTLQVSLTAWFGPGYGFQVYGTDGMLMLGMQDSEMQHSKLRLYGARANLEQLMVDRTDPELLARQFKEITPAPHHYYVTGIERGRGTFAVAQMWHAFAKAIEAGTECPTNFRNQLKIHCVWDATEKSRQNRSWVKVDYNRLGEANNI